MSSKPSSSLLGWMPSLDHVDQLEAWDHVYEPADDTFLLLDALYADREKLRGVIVELGPGSGVVSTYLATLAPRACCVVAIDINPHACAMTAATAAANSAKVDVIRGDLTTCVRHCDVLVFNPPYVTTPPEEVGGDGIEASWAGGKDGRQVIDRLLPLLTADLVYLLLSSENRPQEVADDLTNMGYRVKTLLSRTARNESLTVIRAMKAASV